MKWREFAYLLNGLSGESPLGRIVSVRAEDDPERLKEFSAEEKKIRNEYRRKKAKTKSAKEVDNALESIKGAFLKMSK